jgi:hypothetical protein
VASGQWPANLLLLSNITDSETPSVVLTVFVIADATTDY